MARSVCTRSEEVLCPGCAGDFSDGVGADHVSPEPVLAVVYGGQHGVAQGLERVLPHTPHPAAAGRQTSWSVDSSLRTLRIFAKRH